VNVRPARYPCAAGLPGELHAPSFTTHNRPALPDHQRCDGHLCMPEPFTACTSSSVTLLATPQPRIPSSLTAPRANCESMDPLEPDISRKRASSLLVRGIQFALPLSGRQFAAPALHAH